MNIPDLPTSQIVDKDGFFTDVVKNFFNQLITELRLNASNEGLVAPTQPDAVSPNDHITKIQDNLNAEGQYTCAFGTILYDSTHNSMRIAIDAGGGVPIFKTVTLV